MPVIFIRQITCIFFNQMVAELIFFKSNWISISYLNSEFEIICLINPDSDRISALETFISRKIGVLYRIGQPSWIFGPFINLRPA